MDNNIFINSYKSTNPPQDYPYLFFYNDPERSELARKLMWQHSLPYGQPWKEWLKGYDLFPNYPELPSGPKATLWDGWMCEAELWPAVQTDNIHNRMVELWKNALLNRNIGDDGYVETDQGIFYAHNRGWPFPLWADGKGGYGWHFTFHKQAGEFDTPNGKVFRPPYTCSNEGFTVSGLTSMTLDANGWTMEITSSGAYIETPACSIDSYQSPFIQIRWSGNNMGKTEPYIEWLCEDDEEYTESKRFYFAPCPEKKDLITDEDVLGKSYIMIPVCRHPEWKGNIRRIRIQLGNRNPSGELSFVALFSQYDTRHNINNTQFIKGCTDFFNITRDLDFLRKNISLIRKALRGYMFDHHTIEENAVLTTWFGHDGRSSVLYNEKGEKVLDYGHGMPNNWLDIIPFGHYDLYATVYYYDAVKRMAELEKKIKEHPEWGIGEDFEAFDAECLDKHADKVKQNGNILFWNCDTGRFAAGVDIEGQSHDYGITLINLEAVHAGFATKEHAKEIMDWISGRRIVEGDTSKGEDIYRFIFAPRITTLKNKDYWFWGYRDAESDGFGEQIQDGGAALAFSYFDIMSRIAVYGADDAWDRMCKILDWYGDVCREGGYKSYYENRKLGLQGANVGGALGITSEFFESLLPMQSVIKGFAGFKAEPDRIVINPELPSKIDGLKITQIAWCGLTLAIDISKENKTISVSYSGTIDREFKAVTLKEGWIVSIIK